MKRKSSLFLILLFFLLLFCACDSTYSDEPQEDDLDTGLRIYCLESTDLAVVYEPFETEEKDEQKLLQELLLALSKTPKALNRVNAIPESVPVQSYDLSSDGILVVDFGQQYMNLTGTREVLCRAAIVKTLCQLDCVKCVEFTVAGQPLIINESAAGRMKGSDFIDTAGESVEYTLDTNLTVYFSDLGGEMLSESMLIVSNDGRSTMEELVLEQLISGPLEYQTALRATIPEGTTVNSVKTRDGVCMVDLSTSFLNGIEGIDPKITVYSVVNSLCEISSITKVGFTFNGETRKNMFGLDFSGLFERNLTLISSENKSETSGGDD